MATKYRPDDFIKTLTPAEQQTITQELLFIAAANIDEAVRNYKEDNKNIDFDGYGWLRLINPGGARFFCLKYKIIILNQALNLDLFLSEVDELTAAEYWRRVAPSEIFRLKAYAARPTEFDWFFNFKTYLN